jgi:diacylglycerol O-acyltransferase / wax synthase
MSCDRLTPLDATFLELEELDPSAHMHIGTVMVFERAPGRRPTLARLRHHIEERLECLPRYRRRLSEPRTGGLRWPSWVPDPEFDIEAHIGQVQLPSPGTEAQLAEWAGVYWSKRLDRDRPLWDARLITGLEGGRWAVATKTHHALVDGIGAADVATVLLDQSPRPGPGAERVMEPPEPQEQEPGLIAQALREGLYTSRHPGRLRDAFLEAKAMAGVVLRDEVIAAPTCSLNAPISRNRRYRVTQVPLDELKRVKEALGGTVNDVILAAVTGGLRALLLERGEDVPAPGLRAMVPVNIRSAADRLSLGNKVSSLFVHLPVMEPDPGHRYLLLSAQTTDLKSGRSSRGAADLVTIAGLAPPVLHSILARSTFAARLFNVTVTNVPGPQFPLYALGARMEQVWPLVPLAANHSIGVAAASYDGNVYLGVSGDAAIEAELDVAIAGIEAEVAELGGLATSGHALPSLS